MSPTALSSSSSSSSPSPSVMQQHHQLQSIQHQFINDNSDRPIRIVNVSFFSKRFKLQHQSLESPSISSSPLNNDQDLQLVCKGSVTLSVTTGKITEVLLAGDVSRCDSPKEAGVVCIDGSGYLLLPGLINTGIDMYQEDEYVGFHGMQVGMTVLFFGFISKVLNLVISCW